MPHGLHLLQFFCPSGKALPECAMEGKACREMVHDFDKATFNQEKFDAVWPYLRTCNGSEENFRDA